jgi:hypothetical protein
MTRLLLILKLAYRYNVVLLYNSIVSIGQQRRYLLLRVVKIACRCSLVSTQLENDVQDKRSLS